MSPPPHLRDLIEMVRRLERVSRPRLRCSLIAASVFMRRVNGWLAFFWVAMIPVSYGEGWLNSVTYVSALSLWALVSGHWSAWQAARVDVNQQKKDIPSELVENVVERTVRRRRARVHGLGLRVHGRPRAESRGGSPLNSVAPISMSFSPDLLDATGGWSAAGSRV